MYFIFMQGFCSRLLMAGLLSLILSISWFNKAVCQQVTDLSNIRIEELTDDQVRKFLIELDNRSVSDEQFEKLALQNGLNPVELAKLKNRIRLARKQFNLKPNNDNYLSADSLSKKEKRPIEDFNKLFEELKGRNFAAELFYNPKISFEPVLNIPTPKNYLLAASDEIQIDVSGVSEASYKIKISPEGNIRIPQAGVVALSGKTIEEAKKAIEQKLAATIYSSIRNGKTRVDVSLNNIRTIRINIIGEATVPGTYSLPSLATVFHALYACGGPGANGSYRNIELIRKNRIISKIDIYQYLANGNRKSDMVLQDQDVIKINPYQIRVELKGQVKKPGIYDVAEGEKMSQIVNYAGGFTDLAYTGKIQVFSNNENERLIGTLSGKDFLASSAKRGDVYIVGKILNRFANRVNISGAVYRPGDYELGNNMTITELIAAADGLREDAFLTRGIIHRLKPDLSPELVPFDYERISRKLDPDILLQKEDRVEVYSKFDLKETYYITIDGEVSNPGTFLFEDGMTVNDVILLSGGIKESSSLKRVEISRRVKDTASQKTMEAQTALIFQQEIRTDLRDSGSFGRFKLHPFDQIVIRTAPGYYIQKNVVVEGEILFAGKYTLEAKSDRISDLLKRAGGLSPSAYLKGAVLVRSRNFTRTEQANYEQGIKNLVKQNLINGTSPNLVQAQVYDLVAKKSDFVGIDLQRILDNPHSEFDLFLNDGDTLRIPRQLQTVRVSGEVLYPTLVRYDESFRFKDYVYNAGGFGDRSSRKRSYVVYPNGSIKGTKSFLFFKNYPTLSPGAEIYVPLRRERERLRTGEVITLGATLVSMLAILFSAIK